MPVHHCHLTAHTLPAHTSQPRRTLTSRQCRSKVSASSNSMPVHHCHSQPTLYQPTLPSQDAHLPPGSAGQRYPPPATRCQRAQEKETTHTFPIHTSQPRRTLTSRQCRSKVSASSNSMPVHPGTGDSCAAMACRECLEGRAGKVWAVSDSGALA